MDKIGLIDRLGYYVEHGENEECVHSLFGEKEIQILKTVREFERQRTVMEPEPVKERGIEDTLQIVEREKDISFRFKKQLMDEVNRLMAQETVEAWMDIMTWYQWLNAKQLLHRFWEFHILKNVFDIFIEELKACYSHATPVFVLSLHSMEEVCETYFVTVFLLRRIEYGVAPVDETVGYIREYKLSYIWIRNIIKEAKINDKERVLGIIESWCLK